MMNGISDAALAIAIASAIAALLAGAALVTIRWRDVIWVRMRDDVAPAPAGLVPHVEVDETPAPAGAIGTIAPEVSDDLEWWQTAAERAVALAWDEAHADHDLFLLGEAVNRALVDYENAMLSQREWAPPIDESATHSDPRGSIIMHSLRADHCVCNGTHRGRNCWCIRPAVESVQQRIDRWLREGGVAVEVARSEARRAASETWDSPSRELALVDRPDAERVAEAVLTA